MKYDIFISYKRGGSSNATAAYLYDLLTKKGYAVFFDRKEIRQGHFEMQLYEHIENAKDVIILLDHRSLRACFSDIKDTYKTDWFCMEVMHALKKQKRIIPLLLDGYQMPEAEQLPDEMKALSQQNAISLDIADIEDFYSKYLIGQEYLASKPRNLYLAQAKGEGVADFLFYSEGECDVFECGNLIGNINSNNDEDHPYRFPVQRCGEHRFFCRNNDTCEEQRIIETIDVNSQKYINVKWSARQNLWELNEADIMKQKDSSVLFAWGKGLYIGTSKHEPNIKLAFLCLKEAAAKWNIDARNFIVDHVTDIYDLSDEERIAWYDKAIEFDSPDAYFCLGNCYRDGIGVNQDFNEALRCYEKGLELRKTLYGEVHPKIGESLCNIGYIYYLQNRNEEAVEWVRKAAEQGSARGQCFLGIMYECGQGVEQDYALALEWYRRSAEQGDPRGQFNLGLMYENGRGVKQDYAVAAEWIRKAAEQGYVLGQYGLGVKYEYGRGVEQDYALAVEWYRKAAEQGYAQGQVGLGFMYENGQGIKQDYTLAVEWYRKAAEQGDARGQFNLGLMYENGQGVKQDYALAVEWYRKAAEQDYSLAFNSIAWTYHLLGKYAEALPWAEKAADTSPDDPQVIDTLATVYQGLGRYVEALKQFDCCLKLYNTQEISEEGVISEEGIKETKKKIAKLKKLMKEQLS